MEKLKMLSERFLKMSRNLSVKIWPEKSRDGNSDLCFEWTRKWAKNSFGVNQEKKKRARELLKRNLKQKKKRLNLWKSWFGFNSVFFLSATKNKNPDQFQSNWPSKYFPCLLCSSALALTTSINDGHGFDAVFFNVNHWQR